MKKFTQIRVMFILILLISFFSSISFSQNQPRAWYVFKNATGSNNGTSWTNAWTSFSAIQWSSIQPGDTLFISGGTDSVVYSQTLTIGRSGSAGNPITIIAGKYSPSSSGHSGRVIIDGLNSLVRGIYIPDRNYIVIKGLEIRNVQRGVDIAEYVKGITIDSLNIYDFTHQAAVKTDGSYTLYNQTGEMTVDSIIIKNCRIVSSPTTTGNSDCIYIQRSKNIYIHNNYVRQMSVLSLEHVDCIQAYLVSGLIITNNVLIRDSALTPNAQSGTGDGGGNPGILGSQGSNPTIIANNLFYSGGSWYSTMGWVGGFYLRWYGGSTRPPCYVFNNTVVTNGPLVRGMWWEYPADVMANNIIAQYYKPPRNLTWLTTFDVGTASSIFGAVKVDSVKNNIFFRKMVV